MDEKAKVCHYIELLNNKDLNKIPLKITDKF